MNKKYISMLKVFIATFLIFMFSGCFMKSPKSIYFTGGEKLDKMVRSRKVKVAVLPVVDWSKDEGCCMGYILYSWGGVFLRKRAYKDVGLVVTNALLKSLWKKNAVKIVKKDKLISVIRKANLTKNDIYPNYYFQGTMFYPSANKTNKVGESAPNYEKLYTIGEKIGADIIIIGRVTRNTAVGELPNIITPSPQAILPAISWIYKSLIKKTKYYYIAIDIMMLNIPKREIIAMGGYNRMEEFPQSKRYSAMEKYTSALTFYIPIPEKEDLKKQFIANESSYITSYIVSTILSEFGIPITIRFNFKYEFEDETWKMYPRGYFIKNYGLTKSEYESMFH